MCVFDKYSYIYNIYIVGAWPCKGKQWVHKLEKSSQTQELR